MTAGDLRNYFLASIGADTDGNITPKNKNAVALGRIGGKSKSPKKLAAVRANGAKGGRPKQLMDFMGVRQEHCMIVKCKRKAYRAWGGVVSCRKHYEADLIKTYGSLAAAAPHVRGN